MPGKVLTAKDLIPDPTALSGNELSKSRRTRRRILDGACAILAESGYQGFSTAGVADRANLTRPAMLYHFGSRLELLTATIQHIGRRRLELLEEALTQVITQSELPALPAQLYWKHIHTIEYLAFAELALAARTDPELQVLLEPAARAFDTAMHMSAAQFYPSHASYEAAPPLMMDIMRFLFEGLAHNPILQSDRLHRIASMQHFIHQLAFSETGVAFMREVCESYNAACAASSNVQIQTAGAILGEASSMLDKAE